MFFCLNQVSTTLKDGASEMLLRHEVRPMSTKWNLLSDVFLVVIACVMIMAIVPVTAPFLKERTMSPGAVKTRHNLRASLVRKSDYCLRHKPS